MSRDRSSPLSIGIGGLVGDAPPTQFRDLVQLIDQLGFDGVWISDERFYRDTYPLLTLAALTSPRLQIGCSVTDPYSRHPAITAAAMATVDEISGGRCRIGIGAGGAGFRSLGIERKRPALHLREAIRLIRLLLQGDHVDFDGESVSFHGRLNFRPRPDIPIVVAGRGPAVLEVGGELADAVMIGTFAAEPGIRYAQERIAQGAARTGRDPASIPSISWLYVAIDDDREAARQRVRRGVATALWGSRAILDKIGIVLSPDVLQMMHEVDFNLADAAGLQQVIDVIPDHLIDHLSVAGTVTDVTDRLVEIVELGISELAIWPFPPAGEDLGHEIVPLGQEVVPRLRAALEG